MLVIYGGLCWLEFFKTVYLEISNVVEWARDKLIDFKMKAAHGWSPDKKLQGCAGFSVADM